jgi:hypothetical protein
MSEQSQKLRVMIGVIFFITMIFLFVPYTPERYDLFLLSGRTIEIQPYIYHLFEKIALVLTWFIIATELIRYRFLRVVLIFFVIDLADYILTYNEYWWLWGPFPISWNTAGSLLVGLSLVFMDDR